MGQFSWITSDTKRAILAASARKPQFKVYMLLPDGQNFLERRYAGYGVFGGKDYYEAVAELNLGNLQHLDEEERRRLGIELEFMPKDAKATDYRGELIGEWLATHRPSELLKPRLAEKLVPWASLPDSENDPEQGTGYNPDDDED